jgi:hypothetical protein
MSSSFARPAFRMLLPALAFALGTGATGLSQAPPVQPSPQAPTLNMPAPLGAKRGTALDLILTGSNLAEPTGLWTSFPARVTIPAQNNGKDNGKLKVHLEVPHDAPLGFQHLRLSTTRGMSNFRLFCIDDLPQILENESNHSRSSAQLVTFPAVIVGRADTELSDFFRIQVHGGQRVSFEVLGRRLGSPLDPQITLYSAATGRELPGGHNNDAPGLQTDCRLTCTFSESGEYLVEVRDTMWRGGNDFWYRLRIGDFPCATTPMPLVVRRGSQRLVSFAGPYLPTGPQLEVAAPDDPSTQAISLAPRRSDGLYGWPVSLALSDEEEVLEQEPNNDPAHAQRLPVPGGVSGSFQTAGDIDCFVFAGKKGQRYRIDAQTHELHSPTEVYMVLKDAKGNQLAASDPMAPAARITFTAPADGDYTLQLEDLLYASGPEETYHIRIQPYRPGFDLSVGIDRFAIPPGSFLPIQVVALRHNYDGPIEVSVVGHPDLAGQTTIPAGQGIGTLYLGARPELPPGPYTVRLLASATIGGQVVVQPANLQPIVSRELAGLAFPPRNLLQEVAIAVLEKPPFTVAASGDRVEGKRGTPLPIILHADRVSGFQDEITLTPEGLPSNVSVVTKNFGKGQNDIPLQLNPAANAPAGHFLISFTGKAKYKNREVVVTARPISLILR